MTDTNEAAIQKFVTQYMGGARPDKVQKRAGAQSGTDRAAALTAILRIEGLAFQVCEGAKWSEKPEEFVLSLELMGALKPDEQRHVFLQIVVQLQSSHGIASSPLVHSAVEALRRDVRVLEEVRGHNLLLRFLRR